MQSFQFQTIYALLVLFAACSRNADAGIIDTRDHILRVAAPDATVLVSLFEAADDQPPVIDRSPERDLCGIPTAKDYGLVLDSPVVMHAQVCALSKPVCVEHLARATCPKLPDPVPLRLLKVPIRHQS